jgi:hypothetical protein
MHEAIKDQAQGRVRGIMQYIKPCIVFESPVAQPEKDCNWTGSVGRLQLPPLESMDRTTKDRLPRNVELNCLIISVYYASQTDKN